MPPSRDAHYAKVIKNIELVLRSFDYAQDDSGRAPVITRRKAYPLFVILSEGRSPKPKNLKKDPSTSSG